MGWFYYIGKDRLGPVDDLGLRRLAANRYITPETIIENEQGQSARAGQIRGLEFPAPDANPQPFAAGASASVGTAPSAAQFPTAPIPASGTTGPAGASAPGQGGYEAPGTSETPAAETTSRENAGILDFDLSRIVGDPGTQVNVNLLRNFANICKVYFWIFSITYWGAYLVILVGLFSQSGVLAGLVGLLIGFPLYFIGYFFFRIAIKYGIEVTKLLIRLNQFLEDEEARKAS